MTIFMAMGFLEKCGIKHKAKQARFHILAVKGTVEFLNFTYNYSSAFKGQN